MGGALTCPTVKLNREQVSGVHLRRQKGPRGIKLLSLVQKLTGEVYRGLVTTLTDTGFLCDERIPEGQRVEITWVKDLERGPGRRGLGERERRTDTDYGHSRVR